jgi:hypothetical protein
MKSNELLHDIFDIQDVKRIAPELGLHLSTLYKWCEPDGGKTSGALNPLERRAVSAMPDSFRGGRNPSAAGL